MNVPAKCPFFGSLQVLAGQVIGADGYGFKPDDAKDGIVLTWRHPYAFHFGPAANYCAACAMVSSKADAKDAARFLDSFATEELRARLAALKASRHDLPPSGP